MGLLKAYFLFFGLLFITGFLWTKIGGNEEELLRYDIASEIKTIKKQDQTYHLLFECEGNILFDYNIDTNTYVRSSSSILTEAKLKTNSLPPSPFEADTAFVFFGGLTGGLTIKDAIKISRANFSTKLLKRGRWTIARIIIIKLFGILSGYTAGYYVGTLTLPNCDSAEVAALLVDIREWKQLEQTIFFAAVADIYALEENIGAKFFDTEEFKLAELELTEKMNEIERQSTIDGYDLSSNDYRVVSTLKIAQHDNFAESVFYGYLAIPILIAIGLCFSLFMALINKLRD